MVAGAACASQTLYTYICMSILDGPIVVVDVETNGLSHVRGRVIEVAAIRMEQGRKVREVNTLVDPGTELPQFITNLTGITSADVRSAPTFAQIAEELYELIDGAVFVAHNVRFDYSFLKQEFKRLGKDFLPKQLCTVKLSRALYPEYKSHKLQDLIERHSFTYTHRHRAYDDAYILWQFMSHARQTFGAEVIEAALAKQIRRPALPKALDPNYIAALPASHGVYIFEDEQGRPLYIGKSINIRKRVLSHFGHDHDESKEFKISQAIHGITVHQTSGELEALLLESRLVKDLQPLHNRRLRKTEKLLLARQVLNDQGYCTVVLEEASFIDAGKTADILAVYPRRGKARESLQVMAKTFDLCPKLLGLEKTKGACFLYQLHKCRGACAGVEPAAVYNQRLLIAFEHHRIQAWPFMGPILVQEKTDEASSSGIVVDQWCILAEVTQDEYCEPHVHYQGQKFDLDTYKILRSFLMDKMRQLRIHPLSRQQLQEWGV